MTLWQLPVFLDLVIVNSLRIIRAYIKLGQRKLARVQVFQVTGHCSCTGLQTAKMLSPLRAPSGWLEIELSDIHVGSSFFNVNADTSGLGASARKLQGLTAMCGSLCTTS